MINWKAIELHCKTADLIAIDRKGTARDDGFHRGRREEFERCAKYLVEGFRRISAAFERGRA